MAQLRTSRRFDIIFLTLLAGLLVVAALNRVAIGDWVFFHTHTPSALATQVATAAGLSPYGRHLLYRTNPQFAGLATVNANCDVERLGCLTPHDQAFILTVPGQSDQTTVTAAHEMLHLAYQRLTPSQKDAIAPLLDQAIAANLIIGLGDELSDETTLADRRNEAHSLLGTEYKNIPASLEQYYAQYFTDRSSVLAAYIASQSK